MKKRLLSTLLAVCLILTLAPAVALAVDLEGAGTAESPYLVNDEATLREAIAAGGYVKLTESISISESGIAISEENASIVIDLNGQTLGFTKEKSTLFDIQKGSLTVTDSGEGGKITSSASRAIQIRNGATFTLEKGTVEMSNLDFSADVAVFNFGTLNVNGGVIKGVTAVYNYAPEVLGATGSAVCNVNGGTIQGVGCTSGSSTGANWACVLIGAGVDENGNVKDYSGVILNINGGSITAEKGGQAVATNASSGKYAGFTINMSAGSVIADGENGCGMYLPAIGKTNISGGTVKGDQGIRIAAGELNVTGGEIIGTAALEENADLISGGSGGTQGAIVVGKAGSGYVGDVVVNISSGASVKNTAEGDGTKPAVIVSDKNMSSTNYEDNSISVNIDGAAVEGDVVKVSNLTQGSSTSDGGDTSLTLTNASVTGNVLNQSKEGSVEVTGGTTVTGTVTSENASSVLITDSKVGQVKASDNSSVAIVDSTVTQNTENDTDSTIVVVNSSINGAEPETTVGDKVALVGGKSYDDLASALNDTSSVGQTVVLLVDAALENAIPDGVILSVGDGLSLSISQDKATDVLASAGTLELKAGSELTIIDNVILGEEGLLDLTSGSVEIVFAQKAVTLTSGSAATVPAGKELNLLLPGGAVRLDTTIESGASATVNGQLTVPNDAKLTVDGVLNISSTGLLRVNSKGTLTGGGSITNAGKVTLHRNNADDQEPTLEASITLIPGGEVYSELVNTNVDAKIGNYSKVSGAFTVEGIDSVTFTDKYSYYSPTVIETTYSVSVAAVANGTVTANPVVSASGNTITLTTKASDGYELNTLVAVDAAGNRIVLTDKGNGVYTFTMPASNVSVSAAFTESGTATGLPFTDVATTAWYYDAVKYAYDNALMNGIDATTFAPSMTTTRGMIVTLLYRLENEPAVSGAIAFEDVAAGEYYYDAVSWAGANSIVNGYDEDTFGPNNAITREQMATILYRYCQYKGYDVTATGDLSQFTDSNETADWAKTALVWAVEHGLMEGNGDGTINPAGTATRAEVAQMLMNFCEEFVK